ncbi:MAG: Hpt domain-containing protein, partial [Acidimicrobiia bacterium]
MGGRRVLVVDDNPVTQHHAILILQKGGYDADAVADGAEAMEAVRAGGYDAVVVYGQGPALDVGVPIITVKSRDRRDLEKAIAELVDPSGTPIDRPTLDALRELDDDGETLRSLAEIFVREARLRVERLAAAVRSEDHAEAAATAHSLRGSASTFGATDLAALAGRIETEARSGRVPPVGAAEELDRRLA